VRAARIASSASVLPPELRSRWGPADLEHLLASTREEARQAGSERTSALDCERTRAKRVLIGKTKHAGVSLTICGHGGFEHHSTGAHVDHRERVRVAVRINADHVVQLICKHP